MRRHKNLLGALLEALLFDPEKVFQLSNCVVFVNKTLELSVKSPYVVCQSSKLTPLLLIKVRKLYFMFNATCLNLFDRNY